MAGRLRCFAGNRSAHHFAFFLAGNGLGSRHCVSRVFLAGRRGPLEGRNPFSALVRVGQQWFWRATLHFLSAAFLDAWSSSGFARAVERGAGNFHCVGADARGDFHVRAGAALSSHTRGAIRGHLLRRQSVCAAGCVHAKRFRGGAGVGFPAGATPRSIAIVWAARESLALSRARDGNLRAAFCGHVAFERPRGCIDQLQHGAPFCLGAAGLALGFGLTAFYLLPAAYEQRWVNISQALAPGLQPAENFLYTKIADPEHNQFNWIASSIAVLLMAMAGASAILAYRDDPKEESGGEKRTWQAMLLLSAAAVVLMLRSSLILWEHLPKLQFVQFPWRWMGILAVPYAYFGGRAVRRWRPGWVWAVVLVIASVGTAVRLVHRAWWDSDDIPSLQEAVVQGQGFDGTDEYDPAKDDHTNLPGKAPPLQILPPQGETIAAEAKIRIVRWTAEEKDLTVTSPEPLRLAVRLLDYPAWRVEVNGHPVTPESPESTAQIILPLSPGRHQINLRFARTGDRTLGSGISLIGLLALAGCFWPSRAKPR